MLRRADGFFEQGAWQEAESGYLQVLQFDPPHAYSNHRLGVIAIRQNDANKAIVFFENALAYEPNHPHDISLWLWRWQCLTIWTEPLHSCSKLQALPQR